MLQREGRSSRHTCHPRQIEPSMARETLVLTSVGCRGNSQSALQERKGWGWTLRPPRCIWCKTCTRPGRQMALWSQQTAAAAAPCVMGGRASSGWTRSAVAQGDCCAPVLPNLWAAPSSGRRHAGQAWTVLLQQPTQLRCWRPAATQDSLSALRVTPAAAALPCSLDMGYTLVLWWGQTDQAPVAVLTALWPASQVPTLLQLCLLLWRWQHPHPSTRKQALVAPAGPRVLLWGLLWSTAAGSHETSLQRGHQRSQVLQQCQSSSNDTAPCWMPCCRAWQMSLHQGL